MADAVSTVALAPAAAATTGRRCQLQSATVGAAAAALALVVFAELELTSRLACWRCGFNGCWLWTRACGDCGQKARAEDCD